jgi:archaellum biogenesis ATPase FlaH
MNRKSLVASFGLVAGLAAALSAQAPSSNDKVDQKAVQSIRVKVIGCVEGDAKAGRYILTGAFLSGGNDTRSTVGTAGKIGSGKDLSFENSLSYDLIGGPLKAHLGHEVEIIGITSDARLNNRDALSSAIGSSKHEKTTLTVDSVKMLAAKCR